MTLKIIQIFISAVLLYILALKIPFKEILNALESAKFHFFFIALIITIVASVITTKKWQILLPNTSFLNLLKHNLLSVLYGIVLFGQLSGELVKTYRVSRNNADKATAAASVIFDKTTGIFALFLISLTTVPLTYSHAPWIFFPVLATILIGIIVTLVSFFLPLKYLHSFLAFTRFKTAILSRTASSIRSVAQSYQKYGTKKTLIKTIALSLLYQLLLTVGFIIILKSFNASISFINALWVFSLVSILLFLPLSVAGLGIREGSMVYLLGVLSVPSDKALVASLALLAINIIMGFFGVALDLFYDRGK